MTVRLVILVALMGSGFAAGAQTVAQAFHWKASGRFTVTVVSNGVASDIRGDLRDGERAEAKEGAITARVRSYMGFVTVALTEDDAERGQLFIFEQRNANFVLLNIRPIQFTASGVDVDLDDSIAAAEKWLKLDPKKPESASLAFRQIDSYFGDHPDRLLSDYADDGEMNRFATENGGVPVSKPISKLNDPSGPVDSNTGDYVPLDGPQDQQDQQDQLDPVPVRPRRQVQPPPDDGFFEPNFGPSDEDFPPPPKKKRRKKRPVYSDDGWNQSPLPPMDEPAGLW